MSVAVCVARTLSFFLHGSRLRHGETLHDLVLLASLQILRIHLVWWPLQHATVKSVAAPAASILWPRDTIH